MRIANRVSFFCLLVLTLVPVIGCQMTRTGPPRTTAIGLDADDPGIQDRIFVEEALAGGRLEIAMARIGVERAHNLDLRLLAQRLYDDHSQANRDLEIIAAQEGIPLGVSSLDVPPVAHLSGLSGSQFDAAYLQHMLEAHRSDVTKFEAASRNARSRAVRGFAARTLPALREHLRIAQNIRRLAGLGREVNEAAGAEALSPDVSPFYQGDIERRHQFDSEK